MTSSTDFWHQWRGTLALPIDAAELVPPPRFQATTFDSYRIDPDIPGQAAAVAKVQAFAHAGPKQWWHMHRRKELPGCYLDGDFGVGKTHLLAATWHQASGSKRFLSFSDTMSLAVQLGHQGAIDLLAADLVCIDEFELDDPSNTRMVDLIIDGIVQQGGRLMVTSNTVPGELGKGRMFVDQFRAQLNRVSAAFADIHVPGNDYRQRKNTLQANGNTPDSGKKPQNLSKHTPGWGPEVASLPINSSNDLHISAEHLDQTLQGIPVASLGRLAKQIHSLTLTLSQAYPDQLAALRFVHLIDRLYDWRVPLRVISDIPITEIFLADYRDFGFTKKYRRCQSRLTELCAEHAHV